MPQIDQGDGDADDGNQGADGSTRNGDANNQSTDGDNTGTTSTEGGGTFTTSDGRELSVEDLGKEYENLKKDYTKKTQRLSDYDKKVKASTDAATGKTVDRSELGDVDPEVKKLVLDIVRPGLEDEIKRAGNDIRADLILEKQMEELSEQWDGKDGKPKFDRDQVLKYMGHSESRVFDPEVAFKTLKENEIRDFYVKQALKKQRGGSGTEKSTSGGGGKKPERKTPQSLKEAGRAALERMSASE